MRPFMTMTSIQSDRNQSSSNVKSQASLRLLDQNDSKRIDPADETVGSYLQNGPGVRQVFDQMAPSCPPLPKLLRTL